MLAANAWWLVFGSGVGPADSLPAGQVLLAGVVGGAVVALSRGALLVLAPLAAVVADSVRGDARASGTFAFVVAISDTPGAAVLAGRFSTIRAMPRS